MLDSIKKDIYDGNATAEYEIPENKKEEITNKILEFCFKHNCFCGETLMQDDDCLIESADLIADIIDDIINFKVEWKE